MKKNFVVILLALVAFAALSSVFVVHEGQRGIVLRFNKAERSPETGEPVIYEPGLHFKVPLIEKVKRLDARIQSLEGEQDRFVTSEKKDLIVDSYVKWRIKDFGNFYLKTNQGNTQVAENLLKRKINNGLRSEFGTRTITDIVSGERDEVMKEALEQVAESALDLGIEVVDVRVKQINLPTEVSNSIYDRMRAERQAVAKKHRSEGKEKAEIIRADVDARVTVMLADAERKARTLRGEGDAEAAAIYANSFSANPDFYGFLRSLDAYRNSFTNKNDVLVLKPDSDFFRYMKSSEKQ
ncbi:protease modulator HflC [Gallaecimonas sp. GXIMD4217]|uniref:protease modulator HflC n=1 Tax=Gallaecimonas sp. GXIMD4217 TaxID=3131927 RepID=UPI00311AE708